MTLLSYGVFAYAVNTIGTIFQNIAKKDADFWLIFFFFK